MHDAHVEDRVMVILVFRMAAKVLRFPFLRGAGHQLIIYFMRHSFKTTVDLRSNEGIANICNEQALIKQAGIVIRVVL